MRRSLVDIFQHQGYQVETAETGQKAILKATESYFNVVLVDIKLPDFNGLDLLKALKEIHPSTECIIITGYASLENAIQALNWGAFAYQVKPFNMDELLSHVRQALEKQNHKQEIEQRIIENYDLYEQERKQRLQLQEEEKARSQFTNFLAHELGTPLTPILVCTRLLEERLSQEPNTLEARLIRNIINGAKTLETRLSDMLDLVRFQNNAFTLKMEPLDPGVILEEVVAQFYPLAEEKQQSLTLDLPKSLPLLVADGRRLKQVLLNLLSNAIKFTSPGDKVILQARVQGGDLVIEVEDTGPGIPTEEQEKLFQPYYRSEASRHSLPGLGLGLVISKQLVEAHGGRIWIHSDQGKGSTFGFSLPLGGHPKVGEEK